MATAVHTDADSRMFDKMDRDQFDSGTLARGLFGGFLVVGAILKSQGAVMRDVKQGRNLGSYVASMLGMTVLFTAAYGAILGLHAPGMQTLYASAKLPIVVLGSVLLCTPTFYVFNSILGSKFSFGQTLATVLYLAACAALVLVAFAPIAWFFTVSTEGLGFLVFLHAAFCVIAALYGIRTLDAARRYLGWADATQTPIHGAFLHFWFLIVLLVGFQMAHYMQPLIEAGPFHSGKRGLFFETLWALLQRP